MDIITRVTAIELGLKRYYTGVTCKHGHYAERETGNRGCVECGKIRRKNAYYADLELSRAKRLQWYNDNRESCVASQAAYRTNNPEAVLKSKQKYLAKPGIKEREVERNRQYRQQHLEACREASRSWNRRHPRSIAAHASARRARILQAQPNWVNSDEIATIFDDCPEGYHVDHGIPLKHKLVCGLHVVANLEAISAEANQRKLNYFHPDEWSYDPATSTFNRTPLPGASDYHFVENLKKAA